MITRSMIKTISEAEWKTIRDALIFTIASLDESRDPCVFRDECLRLLHLLNGEEN